MALEAAVLLQEEARWQSKSSRVLRTHRWLAIDAQRRSAALYAAAREAYLFGTGFTSLGVDKWGVL